MYGQGATYDSIEGRFRIIKREAAKLLSEVESGSRPRAPPKTKKSSSQATTSTSFDENGAESSTPTPTPKKSAVVRRTGSTNTTPRAKKDALGGDKVIGGRVSKISDPASKKNKVTMLSGVVPNSIKEEAPSEETVAFDDLSMEMDVNGLAAGLGLDAYSGGSFDMEV
ncbi:MAG: hypothetical protein L6R40_005510 [Gallowayella cf. fulva]|nr:MAG: hypothetical protein L6R40_005510 [Xanthomendoza cf. fulva]